MCPDSDPTRKWPSIHATHSRRPSIRRRPRESRIRARRRP
jgi:hypothetical protein